MLHLGLRVLALRSLVSGGFWRALPRGVCFIPARWSIASPAKGREVTPIPIGMGSYF